MKRILTIIALAVVATIGIDIYGIDCVIIGFLVGITAILIEKSTL